MGPVGASWDTIGARVEEEARWPGFEVDGKTPVTLVGSGAVSGRGTCWNTIGALVARSQEGGGRAQRGYVMSLDRYRGGESGARGAK